jgi:hypothetical protein
VKLKVFIDYELSRVQALFERYNKELDGVVNIETGDFYFENSLEKF